MVRCLSVFCLSLETPRQGLVSRAVCAPIRNSVLPTFDSPDSHSVGFAEKATPVKCNAELLRHASPLPLESSPGLGSRFRLLPLHPAVCVATPMFPPVVSPMLISGHACRDYGGCRIMRVKSWQTAGWRGPSPCCTLYTVCTVQAEHVQGGGDAPFPHCFLVFRFVVSVLRSEEGNRRNPPSGPLAVMPAVRGELHIRLETCCPSSAESPALVWIANPGLCASQAPAATVEGGQSQSSTRHKLACMRMGRDRIWGRLPVRKHIHT